MQTIKHTELSTDFRRGDAYMKRRHCHHVLMMSLVLLLLVTGARRSQPRPGCRTGGPGEQRHCRLPGGQSGQPRGSTAIAQTGAAIEEIGADYVIVRATPQEASQIAALGYPIEPLVRPRTFPRPMRPTTTMPRW